MPKLTKNKIAFQVMKDAIDWSKNPPKAVKNRFPNTPFGFAAIQAYAEDIADFSGKPREYFKETAWLGCHAINPQWTARNSTAVYLERLVADNIFSSEINTCLLAASNEYKAAYTRWKEFYIQLGHIAPENAWDRKTNRVVGGAAVHKALEHEKTAINELEKALALAEELH
jgi:hypothetical protein